MDRRLFLSLMTGSAAAWPSMARAVSRPPLALRRLRLVNCHTGETFDGAYRNDQGPIPRVIDELCVFLRDHHSGEKTQIDVGVIDFLADVLDAVGRDQSHRYCRPIARPKPTRCSPARCSVSPSIASISSAARSIYASISKLSEAMTKARAMQRGGVGWYPHSGFIHIDTGPVRNWTLDEARARWPPGV